MLLIIGPGQRLRFLKDIVGFCLQGSALRIRGSGDGRPEGVREFIQRLESAVENGDLVRERLHLLGEPRNVLGQLPPSIEQHPHSPEQKDATDS
jgi:hypothetical protein